MTGTVILAKGKNFDVRTIDFEWIAESLRWRAKNSEVAKKVLQSMDEFGMDMICADELGAEELIEFHRLLADVRSDLVGENGLVDFLEKICEAIQEDERFSG